VHRHPESSASRLLSSSSASSSTLSATTTTTTPNPTFKFHLPPHFPPPSQLKPGSFLLPPPSDTSHWFHKSVLLITHAGLTNDIGLPSWRAVILNKPTAFSVGEMVSAAGGDASAAVDEGGVFFGKTLGDNVLYNGGPHGKDEVTMIHPLKEMCPPSRELGSSDGKSSIDETTTCTTLFTAGIPLAVKAVEADIFKPSQFKFFYNHVEFSKEELEDMNKETNPTTCGEELNVEVPDRSKFDADTGNEEDDALRSKLDAWISIDGSPELYDKYVFLDQQQHYENDVAESSSSSVAKKEIVGNGKNSVGGGWSGLRNMVKNRVAAGEGV
jgi:hypothetical protein